MEERQLLELDFKSNNNWFLNNLIYNRAFSLALLTILISILMSVFFPRAFFSLNNLASILLSLASIGFLTIGMMLLIISGSFDLSVGANLALGAAVAAYIMNKFIAIPVPLAMIAGISASALAGFMNGIIVSKIKIDALIGTFATTWIIRTVVTYLAGNGIIGLPKTFLAFGQTVFFRFRLPVYYLIILVIIFTFLTSNIKYLRQLYFIGGNERDAKLSGINVDNVRIISFVIMGALAGFAGICLSARLNTATSNMGLGIELQVITAVIIGGGSIKGGRGTIIGAFMGAIFIAIVQNASIIVGVSSYAQGIVVGVILIAAVSVDAVLLRRFG